MIELTRWERLFLFRVVPALVMILAVVAVGLAILVQSNDDNIDNLDDSVANVKRSTERVESFVDELEDETPSETERNAAITRAVQEVPEIRDILCEQFPTAEACQ